jgi:phosphoglucosamine mutase
MPKYFGTDGIRGKSPEWLNDQMAYNIGYALGDGLKAKKLLVGKDTRQSGEHLSSALIQGALDSNVEVINLGIVSSPMLAYLTITEKCFGAMITASHNPSTDNGIKIIHNGEKSSEAQEDILETYLFQSKDFKIKEELRINKEILKNYLEAIEKLEFPKTKLKVVIDSAHGSLSHWAYEILSKYANIHKTIGDKPDGFNINKNLGSTHIGTLVSSTPKGMIGFAFDGDGDRLICVDEESNIVTGDQILAIAGEHFNQNNIVFTQMLNPGIKSALKQKGISSLETFVGDNYVTSALNEHQYLIGRENSGHLIFKNVWGLGDGIISALVVLRILFETKSTLQKLGQKFQPYPELLVNFRGIEKSVLSNDDFKLLFDSLCFSIISEGKVLLRPSGTESLVRLYASHPNPVVLNKFIDDSTHLFESYGGSV